MENAIEVRGLSKKRDGFFLNNVNLTVPKGYIVGLIGENGAGKSTTINAILDLIHKDDGTVTFWGQELSSSSQLKEDIGVVFDGINFYDTLTPAKVGKIGRTAYKQWDAHLYQEYLKRFQLPLDKEIKTLSKGMKMKYALALALSHNAELLIMDEPTSGLDPLIRNQLLKILTDYMANGGKGVFFSTHITSDLDKIADMLIMIDKGHIIFQEEKDALIDTYRIVKGDIGQLTDDMRKCFLNISETAFGFTGITKQAAEIQRYFSDIIIERPTIEDIMLANIGGNKK